ncbi:MAG: hypothetical protein ACJAWH_001131 [Maribacter sp.]|jgi:hypothetical protein
MEKKESLNSKKVLISTNPNTSSKTTPIFLLLGYFYANWKVEKWYN